MNKIIIKANNRTHLLLPEDFFAGAPEQLFMARMLTDGVIISDEPVCLTAAGGFQHASAMIAGDSEIAPSAIIGAGVIIDSGVKIGPDCVIGDRTHICQNFILERNVILGRDNFLGNRYFSFPGPHHVLKDFLAGDSNFICADSIAPKVFLGNSNSIRNSLLAPGISLGNKNSICDSEITAVLSLGDGGEYFDIKSSTQRGNSPP